MSKYPKRTKVNIKKALEMKAKGSSYRDIGKVLDCSQVTVFKAIRDLVLPKDSLDAFVSTRGDILASTQAKALIQITEDKLKDCSAYQLAGITGLLYDKERLERGQSTSNVSVYDVTLGHAKLASERARLLQDLGYAPDPGTDTDPDAQSA